MNVYFGGFLLENISSKGFINHVRRNHIVILKNVGMKSDTVNSYHNIGITKKGLSKKLKSFAVSDDGLIEGIFHPSKKIAGVIWHPERDNESHIDSKLMYAFSNGELFWKWRPSSLAFGVLIFWKILR